MSGRGGWVRFRLNGVMTPPTSKRFFCFIKEKVEGPYTLIELAGLLRSQQIDGETPLCAEGTEEWLLFCDRPEYGFAKEMPGHAIDQHEAEKAHAAAPDWSPKKLLPFLWVRAPLIGYVAFRIGMRYVLHNL